MATITGKVLRILAFNSADEAKRVADLTTFIYDVEKEQFDSSAEFDEFTGVKNLKTIDQFP